MTVLNRGQSAAAEGAVAVAVVEAADIESEIRRHATSNRRSLNRHIWISLLAAGRLIAARVRESLRGAPYSRSPAIVRSSCRPPHKTMRVQPFPRSQDTVTAALRIWLP
jgi:hypothetical protein